MSKWLLPSLTGIIQRAEAQASAHLHPSSPGTSLGNEAEANEAKSKATGDAEDSSSSKPNYYSRDRKSHLGKVNAENHQEGGNHPWDSLDPKPQSNAPAIAPLQAEQQWRSAVATLQDLLADHIDPAQSQTTQAVVLCGPLPLISRADLYSSMATWLFISDTLASPCGLALQLRGNQTADDIKPACLVSVPILEQDALAQEQFCLVITEDFGIVMTLGEDDGGALRFQFSCDPAVLKLCWHSLLLRVRLSNAQYAQQLDRLFDLFAPPAPDYRWMSRFTQRMMQHFALIAAAATEQRLVNLVERVKSPLEVADDAAAAANLKGLDVELLRAIAHEVRTPLATIRTMTRLLLRRKDLDCKVTQRLESIDQECTEQIDRFGLIFKATELETSSSKGAQHLAAMPLAQVFHAGLPRWQNQARRRNLTLELKLPEQMPMVVSDPNMLDQALTGLMDRFTRQLPAYSHIQVEATLAGDQLKLQFQSIPDPKRSHAMDPTAAPPLRKSLGKLLSFQPETGSLSLNLDVTKHLFQALGGKLQVKDQDLNGEVLTVFLPLQRANPFT